MTDFETYPVGTVKNLEAEIERLQNEVSYLREVVKRKSTYIIELEEQLGD